eukprot:5999353-Ditylum_brightwellii.AAC.1
MSQKRKSSDLYARGVDILMKEMVGWKGKEMPISSFHLLISVSTDTLAFDQHNMLILKGYKCSKSDGVPCGVTRHLTAMTKTQAMFVSVFANGDRKLVGAFCLTMDS